MSARPDGHTVDVQSGDAPTDPLTRVPALEVVRGGGTSCAVAVDHVRVSIPTTLQQSMVNAAVFDVPASESSRVRPSALAVEPSSSTDPVGAIVESDTTSSLMTSPT